MRRILGVLSIAFLLLAISPSLLVQPGLASPAPQAQKGSGSEALVKEAKSRIQEITLEQFTALKAADDKFMLIDVREDSEWQAGRVPGAVHISRGVLEFQIEAKVPQKDSKVVLYCRSGARAALAADSLQKLGYTKVYSLAGGFAAYQKAGLPTEK